MPTRKISVESTAAASVAVQMPVAMQSSATAGREERESGIFKSSPQLTLGRLGTHGPVPFAAEKRNDDKQGNRQIDSDGYAAQEQIPNRDARLTKHR